MTSNSRMQHEYAVRSESTCAIRLTMMQTWSEIVSMGNMDGYKIKFHKIQKYFEPRFPEAIKLGNEMIKTILQKTRN